MVSPATLFILMVILGFHEIRNATMLQNSSSFCGNMEIKFPFWLQNDPREDRYYSYGFSCKNNLTFNNSYLGMEYYVKNIDYHNYTIRLASSLVSKDNCSSIPRTAMSFYEYKGNPYLNWETEIRYRRTNHKMVTRQISETVTFLSCKKPVSHNPSYIDTSPCLNSSNFTRRNRGRRYSYAVYGNGFKFSDLEDSCQIYQTALVSPSSKNMTSYNDIHNAIVNGFDLSWIQAFDMGRGNLCYVDKDTNKVDCPHSKTILSRIGDKLEILLYYIIAGFYYTYEYTFGKFLPKIGIHIQRFEMRIAFELVLLLGPRTVVGIPFIIGLIIYKWKRRHLSLYSEIEEFLQSHNNLIPIRYSYSEIKKMTQGFNTKLGEGGFGSVYKGTLRSGHFVAIKMLGKAKSSGQDFLNEVATIGRIHHVNVARLIGFCVEGSKRALVYEFMPNGSLDKKIFSTEETSCPLNSKEIFEISLGVARGIEYLHRGCDMQILHFDIKPHNILLDENFTPKVSDFGLAQLCPVDDSIMSLTAARGTLGYMAPELFYKNLGGVSYKADVYSFGMLLMEMASRRKNLNKSAEHSSQIYYPTWVYDQLSKRNEIEEAAEKEPKMAKKMIIVALWCIQLKPSDRPSMRKVIEMLEGKIESLELPPEPCMFPEVNQNNTDDSGEASTTSLSTLFRDYFPETDMLKPVEKEIHRKCRGETARD